MTIFHTYTSRLTIDPKAIEHNYKLQKKRVAPVEVMCVVKANAYGLGAVEVTKALLKAGGTTFFVATLEEALELRKALDEEFSLYVLEGFLEGMWPLMSDKKIFPVINTLEQLKFLSKEATCKGLQIKAILHYDTGMTRLGLSEDDISLLNKNKQWFEGVSIQYIISHLACSGSDNPLNDKQGERMAALKEKWPQFKYSLLASRGLNLKDKYLFNGVRLGLSLYMPINAKDTVLKQVFKLEGCVLQVRSEPMGKSVGYDRTFITKKPSKIAVINIGFADGYMRACSNVTEVAYKGEKLPLIGRVSMDLSTVDITDVSENEIKEGDWVEFVGPNISVHSLPMSPYELLVRLSSRAKRLYKPGSILTGENEVT